MQCQGLVTQTQRQRDSVLAAEADSYFSAGRYIQSAQAYAQSSKPFEEVVLRFVDKDERDALRYFLVAKLERLKRSVRARSRFSLVALRASADKLGSGSRVQQDSTQRMMLATWLVEIFLAKINELEDLAAAERASEDADNIVAERAMVEEDMRQFLVTYKVRPSDPRACPAVGPNDVDIARRRTTSINGPRSICSTVTDVTSCRCTMLPSSATTSGSSSITSRRPSGSVRFRL